MTRVLVIEPTGSLWGSERALLDLIDSAKQLEIGVCCPPSAPIIPELEARGVRVFTSYIAKLDSKARWQRAWAAIGVLRATLAFRPDVIHLNQSGAYKVVLPTAALLGVRIVGHVRIFEDAAYLARQKPNPSRLKALIAISDAVETEIRRHPTLKGIALHRIYDAYVPRNAVRRDLVQTERLACVGRVTPIKGQEVLVAAFAVEGQISRSTECLVVGGGDDDYVCELRKRAGGADPRLRWLGFVQDVGPLLSTCRVLACPSHREPLGRVILEAWEAGAVPVAYAGSGGAAEIISASGGGILYETQTPECLARALAAAIRLPTTEMERYIRNGRSWMAANCDVERYGQALGCIFSAAAARPEATRVRPGNSLEGCAE